MAVKQDLDPHSVMSCACPILPAAAAAAAAVTAANLCRGMGCACRTWPAAAAACVRASGVATAATAGSNGGEVAAIAGAGAGTGAAAAAGAGAGPGSASGSAAGAGAGAAGCVGSTHKQHPAATLLICGRRCPGKDYIAKVRDWGQQRGRAGQGGGGHHTCTIVFLHEEGVDLLDVLRYCLLLDYATVSTPCYEYLWY